MKAGHLYLPHNQYDLTGKSGIYTLFEHYSGVNGVQIKNVPINTIYENFKTNNLNKYPYLYTNNIEIINNETANIIAAGLIKDTQTQVQNSFISITIYPKKDGVLSFNLYNPNVNDHNYLEYVITNCYGFYINSESIDLNAFYIDNPISLNYLFSQFNYNLSKDTLYDIRFEFKAHLSYCIEEQDLCVADIIFPYT